MHKITRKLKSEFYTFQCHLSVNHSSQYKNINTPESLQKDTEGQPEDNTAPKLKILPIAAVSLCLLLFTQIYDSLLPPLLPSIAQ